MQNSRLCVICVIRGSVIIFVTGPSATNQEFTVTTVTAVMGVMTAIILDFTVIAVTSVIGLVLGANFVRKAAAARPRGLTFSIRSKCSL